MLDRHTTRETGKAMDLVPGVATWQTAVSELGDVEEGFRGSCAEAAARGADPRKGSLLAHRNQEAAPPALGFERGLRLAVRAQVPLCRRGEGWAEWAGHRPWFQAIGSGLLAVLPAVWPWKGAWD